MSLHVSYSLVFRVLLTFYVVYVVNSNKSY